MKDLNSIKEEIKCILCNFNPEKSTYKTLNDVVNNDYDVNYILNLLSKIRGINKYPEELKSKFSLIVSSLKEIANAEDEKKKQELIEKELKEKEKEEIKRKQEENTRELKDIIESIEKSSIERKNKKVIVEDNKEQKGLNETLEKIDNNEDDDLEDSDYIVLDFGSKKFLFVLFGLILVGIISLILVFIFY